MSQSLIFLSVRALKVKPAIGTPIPPVALTPPLPTTPHTPTSQLLVTTPTISTGIPTHVRTVPLEDFKKGFRQDVGNYNFFH